MTLTEKTEHVIGVVSLVAIGIVSFGLLCYGAVTVGGFFRPADPAGILPMAIGGFGIGYAFGKARR